MKRLGFSAVGLVSAILIVFSAMELLAVPSTVSFQGVLRSSSGTPVTDGSYSTTFSLWTAPTGGSQVWTEVQSVSTSGGLFTVELGKLESLGTVFPDNSDISLYLQVQVMISGAPVTMSPRTPILSAPYSSTSSSVQGDFKTKPATIIVRGPIGGMSGSTTATIRMQATGDSGVVADDWDDDDDGIPESSVKIKSGPSGSSTTLGGMSGSTTGTIRMEAKPDSANFSMSQGPIGGGNHADGWNVICVDGVSQMTGRVTSGLPPGEPVIDNLRIRLDALSSSVAINTKGTGADKGRTASSTVDELGARTTLTTYEDSDPNVALTKVSQSCDDETAAIRVVSLNGLPPGVPWEENLLLSTNGTSSKLAIKTKGTSAHRSSSTTDVTGDSAVSATDWDDDDDGIPESSVKIKSSSTGSSTILGGHSGSTTGTIRMQASGDSGSTILLGADVDGDGGSYITKVSNSGTEEGNIFLSTATRHSGSTTGTIRMHATPDSASSLTAVDVDNNGTPDVGSRSAAIEPRSILETYFETGDIPTESRTHVTTTADASGATMEMQARLNGLPPGEPVIGTLSMTTTGHSAGIAIGEPGVNNGIAVSTTSGSSTVSTTNRFGSGPRQTTSMDGSFSHARMECATDVDNDGTPDVGTQSEAKVSSSVLKSFFQTGDFPTQSQFSTTADSGGTTTEMTTRLNGLPPGEPVIGTLSMTTTQSSAEIAIGDPGVNGNRISMTASTPTGVHMAVGSATCDGTNWINASSKSLKENFEAVNGEEVLEKVEELPITRWNYKSEDDNVTHIGPTAEDFHKAFGVGETDKAISTIDPSGVALAAIKELAKKNKQLEAQNDQLKKQLNDLQKSVEKLLKQSEKSR